MINRVNGSKVYVITGTTNPATRAAKWASLASEGKYRQWEQAQKAAMMEMEYEKMDYNQQLQLHQASLRRLDRERDKTDRSILKLQSLKTGDTSSTSVRNTVSTPRAPAVWERGPKEEYQEERADTLRNENNVLKLEKEISELRLQRSEHVKMLVAGGGKQAEDGTVTGGTLPENQVQFYKIPINQYDDIIQEKLDKIVNLGGTKEAVNLGGSTTTTTKTAPTEPDAGDQFENQMEPSAEPGPTPGAPPPFVRTAQPRSAPAPAADAGDEKLDYSRSSSTTSRPSGYDTATVQAQILELQKELDALDIQESELASPTMPTRQDFTARTRQKYHEAYPQSTRRDFLRRRNETNVQAPAIAPRAARVPPNYVDLQAMANKDEIEDFYHSFNLGAPQELKKGLPVDYASREYDPRDVEDSGIYQDETTPADAVITPERRQELAILGYDVPQRYLEPTPEAKAAAAAKLKKEWVAKLEGKPEDDKPFEDKYGLFTAPPVSPDVPEFKMPVYTPDQYKALSKEDKEVYKATWKMNQAQKEAEAIQSARFDSNVLNEMQYGFERPPNTMTDIPENVLPDGLPDSGIRRDIGTLSGETPINQTAAMRAAEYDALGVSPIKSQDIGLLPEIDDVSDTQMDKNKATMSKMPHEVKYKTRVIKASSTYDVSSVKDPKKSKNLKSWEKLVVDLYPADSSLSQERKDALLKNAFDQITIQYSGDKGTMEKAHILLLAIDNAEENKTKIK